MALRRKTVTVDPTIAAICELIQGATMLKAVRNGKPHFRTFALSKDLLRLTWNSPNKKDASVAVSQITELIRGQKTKIFENNPVPEYESISFSIIYEKRSLDIVCKDRNEFDTWTIGLEALIAGFSDVKMVEEVLAKMENKGQDKMKVNFDSLGNIKISVREDSCDVYTWGFGERGILGHGEEEDEKTPRVLEAVLGRSVKMLALGKQHSMALGANGEVYTWGSGQWGRLGHSNLHDRFLPLCIGDPLDRLDIVCISCNEYHSAAVSDNGTVYVWGRSSSEPCGRLGFECARRAKVPTPISSITECAMLVACGRDHTVVVTENSRVYAFGENNVHQLGLGHNKPVASPMLVEGITGSVVKVACGTSHTAILNDAGAVFMWGANECGQCGLGEQQEVETPRQLHDTRCPELADVACGETHSAMVDTTGVVYTCGSNADGQLGLGTKRSDFYYLQTITISNVKIIQIACSSKATAAVADNGRLYTWGCGEHGQLGHPDLKNRYTPCEVTTLLDKQVRGVACGTNHMAVMVVRAWVSDDEAKNCMMCKLKFTAVRRRHHCRQCGGVYCGSCTTKRYPLLDKGLSDPVRVCDRCYGLLSQKR